MDKKVFKEYMNKELIQKTIIFADTLGLSIDNWHPAKEESKYQYRVYLYEKKNIIGYIDPKVEKISEQFLYIENFSIVLYTPIGNVEATFDKYSNTGAFFYEIATPTVDTLKKIEGETKIEKNNIKDYYDVSATISFKDNSEDYYKISFNNCIGYGLLYISKNYGLEELHINENNYLSLSHKINLDNEKNINKIMIKSNPYFSPIIAEYKFNDLPSYQKNVTLEDENSNPFKFDTVVDIEKVKSEIKLYDSQFFDLIDEVRALLTVSNHKKTFSLYDKLAYHSFHNSDNRIKKSLIKDENVSEKLKKNPVLQKMSNYKKTSI